MTVVGAAASLATLIDTGGKTGTEVARAFEEAGYIRVAVVQDGETYWETTIMGNALAQASLGPPITRGTAERHLSGVIERAKSFNDDGSHLVDIAELIVFGSYLEPDVQQLGDLDLGISFRSRRPDTISVVDWNEIVRAYARASARSPRSCRRAMPSRTSISCGLHPDLVVKLATEGQCVGGMSVGMDILSGMALMDRSDLLVQTCRP